LDLPCSPHPPTRHSFPTRRSSDLPQQGGQAVQAPVVPAGGNGKWTYGSNKSAQKWQNQMSQRGWTEQQVNEAIDHGQQFPAQNRSEEHTSELQSHLNLVCRLLLEK